MPEKVLRILQKHGSFVSGELISRELGISRAAVWKKIGVLRRKGFSISAVRSKGYILECSPDLSLDEIKAGLAGSSLWKSVLLYEMIDSTNESALSLASKNHIENGTVIVSDGQTMGKGRLGRTWVSPPGSNIHMSLFLSPTLRPYESPFLTLIAAAASVHAIRLASGLPVSIKWPNDLYVRDRKIGGILTECRSEPDRITHAVIGIGLNVNCMCRQVFPPAIAATATSILEETGTPCHRSSLIVHLADKFEERYGKYLHEGSQAILAECRNNSSTIGRRIRAEAGSQILIGDAVDISDDGSLLVLLDSGEHRKIRAGDITHLRQ